MALEILRNDNYASWSDCIENYLLAHNLRDIVEATTEPPKPEEDIIQHEDWRIKNDAALDAIHALCGLDILAQIRGISSAKIVWETLAKLYGQLPQGDNPVTGLGKSANVSVSKEVRPLMRTGANQIVEQGNPSNVTGLGNSAHFSESDEESVEESEEVMPMPTEALQQIEEGNSSNYPAGRDNAGSDYHAKYVAFLKAVESGDLKAVQDFLKLHPKATVAKVTWRNETALHIAVIAEKTHIIEELVKEMSPEDLAIRDRYGFTALHRAAASEDYRMAECMIKKNPMLLSMISSWDPLQGYIPVVSATNWENEEMAHYLYPRTPLQDLEPEKGHQGASLIYEAILAEYFDIALDLIERCPRLARTLDRYKKSPLYALSRMPKAFPSGNRLVFWKRWIYNYCIHIESGRATKDVRLHISNDQERGVGSVGALTMCQLLASHFRTFFGFEQLHDMKLRHVLSRQLLSRICEEISTLSHEDKKRYSIYQAFFKAAENGIFEIVFEMMRRNPTLAQEVDTGGRKIFMNAVLNRQAEIFSLIYGLKRKKVAVAGSDKVSGNNILHMAGVLTTSTPLNHIPGAALQMQRELQWFKEVESIVSPAFKIKPNKDKLTPKQLFTLNHEELRKKGEKWMQSTATSCTVVGSLIITVMFAVAFTVPGGNDQNTGFPIFGSENLFILFMIFDSISLFSSSASVLMFLGVLTSRYAEEDFLKSLPKKLIIGLFTLFFSIATMMITFSFALLLILRERSWIAIPIISLASIPITLFALMQFPLLVDMLKSTYGKGIFNRNMKPWL